MKKGKIIAAILAVCMILSMVTIVMAGGHEKDKIKSLLNKGKYIPDIATFLQIGANSPQGMSWDGRHVYFSSGMSGAPQVYRITDDDWPYQLTTFEDGYDFFSLAWNNDMAIVGADVGGSEYSQLFLMDTMTGRLVQLTDNPKVQYGSVVWARDDKSFFFRSNEENGRDFFIYRMDIATGEHIKVFDGSQGYNACADLSDDGNFLIVYNFTSNANNDLYLVDLTTLEVQKLTEDDIDVTYLSPTLMPDNKTIWLVSNNNKDKMSRIATMKVGSPKVTFIKDKWLDNKWEVEGIGFSRDFKYMGAQVNEDGYGRLRIREVESKKELPTPPLDGILGFGGMDKNGNLLLSFYSPTRAPDVWKWNPHTEELEQLTFSIYAGIDREMFRDPELIRYESFDGLEVPAFLYLPPNYKKGEKIPFVIDAHGGPEGQFRPYFIRNFQYMMLNGYGVLAPNPRGSTGYGLEYMNMDNYKKRKDSLKDYKAAADWLIENGYSEKGKLAIRGGSYGGYVVLGMITEYPDLFSAAIDVVGVANFVTFLENTADYRRALREAEYGPLTDREFLASISPIHKVDLIETPLLVVHGENDPRVPVGEARQIIRAIEDKGGAVDSLIFPDEGHGSAKRVNTIKEYRKHIEFLDKHLK